MDYTSLNDAELIKKAKDGQEQAFAELVHRHSDKVYGKTSQMVRDSGIALDLSQEAWVRIWSRLNQFEGSSPFTTWITRIAINVCLDYFRKVKRRPPEVSIDELTDENGDGSWTPSVTPDPLKDMAKLEMSEILAEAMEFVSEEHRKALSLMYFEHKEYKEIAKIMGCSQGTVMSRLFYGKKSLEKQIRTIAKKRGIDIEESI